MHEHIRTAESTALAQAVRAIAETPLVRLVAKLGDASAAFHARFHAQG